MTAHFRVFARMVWPTPRQGTVIINRKTGLLSVRPLRSRRIYSLPLSTVAEIVCCKVIKAELAAHARQCARRRVA